MGRRSQEAELGACGDTQTVGNPTSNMMGRFAWSRSLIPSGIALQRPESTKGRLAPAKGPWAGAQGKETGRGAREDTPWETRLRKAGRQSVLRQTNEHPGKFCGARVNNSQLFFKEAVTPTPVRIGPYLFGTVGRNRSLLVPPRPKIIAYGSSEDGRGIPLQKGRTWDRGRRSHRRRKFQAVRPPIQSQDRWSGSSSRWVGTKEKLMTRWFGEVKAK